MDLYCLMNGPPMFSVREVISGKHDGEIVEMRGWIYRTRSSAKLAFPQLRDSTGSIQLLVEPKKVGEDQFEDARKALVESSIRIKGEVVPDERAPGGREVHCTEFEVISFGGDFPIAKDFSTEHLLDNRHLWLRSKKMTSIMKVRSTVTGAIHDFFRERGYYEFDPPIFTPNACEGGSTLFEVKYFDTKTYLTQSWQLYAEAAIFALEKIYDMAPTFRAEPSKTSRHITEFWMAEMEAAWLTLEDVTEIAKDEIKFILRRVLEENVVELHELNVDVASLEKMLEKEWPTITYTKALEILKEKSDYDVVWGKDLRTVEEQELMKHFDTPVVVIHYPKEAMAFYKPVEGNPPDDPPGPVAKCFDMLAPNGTEIIGGSERDTDIDSLKEGLDREGESIENYDWYLDLRRYGSVVHSGYGVGVERVIAWILELDHIRDAIAFPRTMNRISP